MPFIVPDDEGQGGAGAEYSSDVIGQAMRPLLSWPTAAVWTLVGQATMALLFWTIRHPGWLSAVLPMAVEIGKQVAESEGANKREQNVLARNYIKNIMQDGKNDFVNEGIGSPMAKAVDKLSRMPSDQRKAAVVRFRLYNDREPDLSSISDLQQLMEFSQSITK